MSGLDLGALKDAAQATVAYTPPPRDPGRLLVIDGDALAYRCAGNDTTTFGQALERAQDCIFAAASACGAGTATLLFTEPGSAKGGRYAAATVEPYQGRRASRTYDQPQRAPLRARLKTLFRNTFDGHAWEADDGFDYALASAYKAGFTSVVLHYDDKDMQQITGVLHLTWRDLALVDTRGGGTVANGKVYGLPWLMQQALQGDTSDSVPGIGQLIIKGKPTNCGPVRAARVLDDCDGDYITAVHDEYVKTYGDAGSDRLVEQLVLLGLGGISAFTGISHPIVDRVLAVRGDYIKLVGEPGFELIPYIT